MNSKITIPPGKSGNWKTTCSACSEDRKKKSDRCLSVATSTGLYLCHHCGDSGILDSHKEDKSYDRPKDRYIKASNDVASYFEGRGINGRVLEELNVFEITGKSGKAIVFKYLRGGELIRVKYRMLNEKKFVQEKNCEPIFYNIDSTIEQHYIIIVEGEIDVLSYHTAGLKSVVSIPNGAKDNLECLKNCFDYFDNEKTIYLSIDNDEPGKTLEENLISRFGKDRIKIIDLPLKDANDVLCHRGKQALIDAFEAARELPIDGMFHLDLDQQLKFKHTEIKASPTGVGILDGHYSWLKPQVKCVTGIPGHGKTQYELWLMILKSMKDGWKWCVFSPEYDTSNDFYDELIEMYVGKKSEYTADDQYLEAAKFIKKHFFYVYPDEDQTPENIRKTFKQIILKYGVDGVMIDPFNQMDHDWGNARDLYLSDLFKVDKSFARKHNVMWTYVAHPTSQRKLTTKSGDFRGFESTKIYDISGGSMWANKMDVIHSIHRPNIWDDKRDNAVELHIEKQKNQKVVGVPEKIEFSFNVNTRRYVYQSGTTMVDEIERLKNNGYTGDMKPNTDFNEEQEPIPETTSDIPF